MRTALIALALCGCVGVIGDAPEESDEPPASLGAAPLRRLTAREYRNAVRDVLGVDVSEVAFPDDGRVDGFDNNALVQTVTPAHARRYQEAAELAAERLPPEVIGCTPIASCVERFGRLLYRRPLTASERDALVALGPEDMAMAVRAMLQAPQFLFRIERGAPVPERPEVVRLNGYELATRLAFALWATTPNDALLDAAEAGELDTIVGLEKQARAMAADPRAHETLMTFAEQWLRLDAMATVELDPVLFPAFTPELRFAAVEEVRALAAHVLAEDALSLYDGAYREAGPELVALYGDALGERGGLFGTAGFLMVTSSLKNTSIVHRGKYVREVALCDRLPPPPPAVSAVPLEPGASAADAFLQHSSDPACSACHMKLDPIGLGLERFDAVGALRSHYVGGEPVPLEGFVDEATFGGAVELGRVIASDPRSSRCIVEQYLRFTMGKTLERADSDGVDEIAVAFEGRLADLAVALVRTDAFRYYRREP